MSCEAGSVGCGWRSVVNSGLDGQMVPAEAELTIAAAAAVAEVRRTLPSMMAGEVGIAAGAANSSSMNCCTHPQIARIEVNTDRSTALRSDDTPI